MLVTLQYKIEPDCEDSEETLMNLDKLTSSVIANGGTVSAKSRRELDEISPYLIERMAGRAGFKLQMDIKKAYDPNNVFRKDMMFPIDSNSQKNFV